MRRAGVSILGIFLAAVVCMSSIVVEGQEPSAPANSKKATALAKKYLGTIERAVSFPSTEGGDQDVIYWGQSLNPPHGWRIIAISKKEKPLVVFDSFSLHDAYLGVTGLSAINAEADGHNGYVVTWRGCVPHQCSDGRIGFALYASQDRRTYRAHILTMDDNSYHVAYYPKSGIPGNYRKQLDEMMCSDNGISRPSTLPNKCLAR